MNNPRMTVKERNLLKGAIRRVFSRSDLRRQALSICIIQDYHDPSRPRVTKWGRCSYCNKPEPLYLMQVDHQIPIIPTNSALEFMSWDEVVNRTWCEKNNLFPSCKPCHSAKSKIESKERRDYKRSKKNE